MKTNLPTAAPLASAELLTPEGRPAYSQKEMARAWFDDLTAEEAAGLKSRLTVEAYTKHAEAWLAWLAASGVVVPTPAHVLAYLGTLKEGHKPATVNAHLAAVRAFYTWTEARNLYPAIARSVRGLRTNKEEPLECLTPGKVAGLLSLVVGDDEAARRDRALLQVMFSTACRLTSLEGANVEDVDLLEAALTFRGKGDRDKVRRVYLSASALEALRLYLVTRRAANGGNLDATAPLFAVTGNRAKGGRMTSRSLRRVVVGLMEKAGHVRRDEGGRITRPRVLSAHSLRRSALTAAYDAAGLDAAQTLAGHADPKTTRRAYARVKKGEVLRGLAVSLDLATLGAAV